MKRQTFFFVVLAVLTLVGNGFSQSGGLLDSAVNVIAKDGIFIVGGTGKEPFSQQACTSSEVYDFLDSAQHDNDKPLLSPRLVIQSGVER